MKLIVLAVLLFASPAFAAFDTREKESVKACMDSLNKLGLAQVQVSYALRGTNASNRALYSSVIEALHRTSRGQSTACYALLGGNVPEADKHGDRHLDEPISPATRTWQLDQFRLYTTGSLADTIPGAIFAVGKAVRVSEPQGPLLDARRLLVESMRAMQRVDTSLTYADPTPLALKLGQTVPTVVGPHGSYVRAMYHFAHAHHYWLEGMYERSQPPTPDRGFLFIYRGAPDWTSPYFAEAYHAHAEGVRQIDAAAARVAGLSEGDQFCSILKAGELLWSARDHGRFGVPEIFLSWYISLMTVGMSISNPAADGGPTPEALAFHVMQARTADSWAHANAAMSMLGFHNAPQTVRCQ